MSFTIDLADKKILVTMISDSRSDFAKDYFSSGTADFAVTTTQTDIELEREISAREDKLLGNPIQKYTDAYLERIALYRKIALKMLDYDTFVFHGSVIAVDNEAFLFTAKSGTGKSTHTRLWRQVFGDRAVMVNDDKPLLKVTDTSVIAYGTPWDGKHRLSNNIAVPLKGICILERAKENKITKIGFGDAYPMLLQQSYRPKNSEGMIKTLKLIDKIGNNVNLFRLGCNIKEEAAIVAYNGMKGTC